MIFCRKKSSLQYVFPVFGIRLKKRIGGNFDRMYILKGFVMGSSAF
jgi:hypothetical protein